MCGGADSFDAMDGNHDHRLSQEEFAAGCERAGFALSSTEVSEEFRRCDADGGGFVLFHEFCSWCAEQSLQLRVSLDESGKEARSVSQRCAIAVLLPPLLAERFAATITGSILGALFLSLLQFWRQRE